MRRLPPRLLEDAGILSELAFCDIIPEREKLLELALKLCRNSRTVMKES